MKHHLLLLKSLCSSVWYHCRCIDHWGLVFSMFEVFYRYLYCTLIGRMSFICMCISHLGFFVHCCGFLSHMFCCIGHQEVSVHWCGCYTIDLQLSCMVVMILVVIWASCDWITSHVLSILLLGFSSYNLVHVHFHDSVRSGYSSSNSISQSVLIFRFFWNLSSRGSSNDSFLP